MSDIPVQVIVAAFQNVDGAGNALARLKQAQKEKYIEIEDAAVLTKDFSGKVKIKETQDMGAGKGAVIGAITGGVISLLAGPLGWMALGGGLLGGLAAKLADGGFSDAQLQELASSMTPGSSALVAVVEHRWVADIERELAAQNAKIVREELRAELAQSLRSGSDVVFTVTDTGDDILVTHAESTLHERDGESIVAATDAATGDESLGTAGEGQQEGASASDMPTTTATA